MFAKLMNGGMVVAWNLIGERQIRRVENARIGAEQLKQPRGFLDNEARIGSLSQGAVEQQNARRWLIVAETQCRTHSNIRRVECRQQIGVVEFTKSAHARSSDGSIKINPATKCAASAPTSWAAMKPGTLAGAIPAKLLLSDRAIVIAGLAKLVDEVNQ